jgi:hypothetical protein
MIAPYHGFRVFVIITMVAIAALVAVIMLTK